MDNWGRLDVGKMRETLRRRDEHDRRSIAVKAG
jgi:hypothetical protein